MKSEKKHIADEETGFKILIPNKLLPRLQLLLARIKAGSNSNIIKT